mmetsp:Transcript_58452/g.137243  ORF Transcript_58452/g.137243 Transcript_58452/m.137243 type:complete len:230 (+) Transcript_58452:382-1071(+)
MSLLEEAFELAVGGRRLGGAEAGLAREAALGDGDRGAGALLPVVEEREVRRRVRAVRADALVLEGLKKLAELGHLREVVAGVGGAEADGAGVDGAVAVRALVEALPVADQREHVLVAPVVADAEHKVDGLLLLYGAEEQLDGHALVDRARADLDAALPRNDIDLVVFQDVFEMVGELARLHRTPVLVAVRVVPDQRAAFLLDVCPVHPVGVHAEELVCLGHPRQVQLLD